MWTYICTKLLKRLKTFTVQMYSLAAYGLISSSYSHRTKKTNGILQFRLFLSLWSRIHQELDWTPTNRERELGLDRRETGYSTLPIISCGNSSIIYRSLWTVGKFDWQVPKRNTKVFPVCAIMIASIQCFPFSDGNLVLFIQVFLQIQALLQLSYHWIYAAIKIANLE